MKSKYNIYKLKENDTLINVAKRLEKTPQEVAHFHNVFANQESLIGVTFPKDLQELYIPRSINEKELEHLPKVKFNGGTKLGIKSFKNVLLYQVKNQIFSQKKIYKYNYQIEVKYIKKVKENYWFEVNKLNKVKDNKLDGNLYNVIEKTEEVFYPLQLLISEEGNLIEIYKHEEIVERWPKLKTSILEEFEGIVIENYLLYYEKNIFDKEKLQTLLFKDVFLNTYFSQVYIDYSSQYNVKRPLYFPLISRIKDVEYEVEQKIDPYVSKEKQIHIEINGHVNDKRVKLDFESNLDMPFFSRFENSNEKVEGKFKAKFNLNSNKFFIEKAELISELELDSIQKNEISIELISNSLVTKTPKESLNTIVNKT